MPEGGRSDDDDEDDAVENPPMIQSSKSATPGRDTRRRDAPDRANAFVRELAGRVALELATTPEGRAAGLSVEVWPEQGVWLRVRRGHELRIFVDGTGASTCVRWERVDPAPRGGRPQTSQGSLGPLAQVSAKDLRTFMARWLAWRARG